MSPPVFLAERSALLDRRVVLDGAEGRHAAVVRRLAAGERVDITDGAGLVAECVVTAAGRDGLELEVVARREEPPPAPRIVVVQALPKGDRGELAVETMTEVGVDEIVPWAAARCVTQWRGQRGEKSLARWRSTAREAAKQARRPWLPEIADLATSKQITQRVTATARTVILHEEAETPLSDLDLPTDGDITLIIGPEGGLTDHELTTFTQAGGTPALLGPTVLRTSTAGVAAASTILTRTGRW